MPINKVKSMLFGDFYVLVRFELENLQDYIHFSEYFFDLQFHYPSLNRGGRVGMKSKWENIRKISIKL